MHVALDVRATGAHFPGIGRATLGLLGGLHGLETDFRIELVANRDLPSLPERAAIGNDSRFHWHTVTAGPFALRQQWELPALARRLGVDCWHAPYYIRPYWPSPPVVVTIYDLIGQRVPHSLPSTRSRLLFALTVRLSVRGARQIITTSQSSARDLQVLHRVPFERLQVIPLAVDGRFRPQDAGALAACRERYGVPRRYLLYLGSNKPHKQPEVAVRAFMLLQEREPALRELRLVVAGRWDPRFPEAQRAAAPAGDRILFRPDIADADLPALIGGAEAFVFPSLYEGFGLPPLEAMACGTPVVVSDRSSLPEVVGDAGLLVAPEAEAFAAALSRLLGDRALQATLHARGLERAARFTWERVGRQTLEVYRQAIARRS